MECDNKIINENESASIQYTYDTIMALVDAVIPRTPNLAQLYGNIMLYGALDFYTDEYMVMILNNYIIPLSYLTAEMLNTAAKLYLHKEGTKSMFNNRLQEGAIFAELSPQDRLRALTLIEEVYFSNELLFKEYPGFLSIVISLNRFIMLGYYSEWFGYGSTRLDEPNQRILQYYPPSWEQVSYPGPSLGYISFVNEYYTIKNNNKPLQIS